jgi:hypothetical protein
VDLRGEAEPLEDGGRARLRRVAVVPLEGLLENREAIRVEVLVRLREDLLLLDHRLPQLRVPHQRDLQDLLLLVEELVLPQDAQTRRLRNRDRPLARLLVAREDPEERRLPGAVGAHEAVPLARVELEGGVAEEHPLTELTSRDWRPRSWGGI